MDPHTEDVSIGPARPEDVAALPAIERAAGALFAGLDLPDSVLDTATPLADFEEAERSGLLWVARAADGSPVGFALVDLVGGAPHTAFDPSPRASCRRACASWWRRRRRTVSILRPGW